MTHTELGALLVSSRSFQEYVAMFTLDETDLSGSVLDCPAGASSFTALACEAGAQATACDIAYTDPPTVLGSVRAEMERGNRYVAAHPEGYSTSFFSGPREHLTHRLTAVDTFTRDFVARPGSYVHGALPDLPFGDRSFDLVLSSHLLFSYADRLDLDTHIAYLTELVRVSRGQVRVFPLTPMGSAERYPHLDDLRGRLRRAGIGSVAVPVDYEFQRGGIEMLVCERR